MRRARCGSIGLGERRRGRLMDLNVGASRDILETRDLT